MCHDPDEGFVRREQLPPDETPEDAADRKAMSQPDPTAAGPTSSTTR